MKRLTLAQRRSLAYIRRSNQILFRRVRGNAERHVPRTVTLHPAERVQIIRLFWFMLKAFRWMGKRLPVGTVDRGRLLLRAKFMRRITGTVRKLFRPGRTAPYFVTGRDAEDLFSNLDLVHRAFSAWKTEYTESAKDIKKADEEAVEALWAIRSILNVGHLPVGKRSDRFGR